jgi:hypothetical protein
VEIAGESCGNPQKEHHFGVAKEVRHAAKKQEKEMRWKSIVLVPLVTQWSHRQQSTKAATEDEENRKFLHTDEPK